MKYYIPYKLNRDFVIYNYSIQDFLILIVLFLIAVNFFTTTPIPAHFFLIVLILRFRIDNVALSGHLMKRLRFIFRKNLYLLSECGGSNEDN